MPNDVRLCDIELPNTDSIVTVVLIYNSISLKFIQNFNNKLSACNENDENLSYTSSDFLNSN